MVSVRFGFLAPFQEGRTADGFPRCWEKAEGPGAGLPAIIFYDLREKKDRCGRRSVYPPKQGEMGRLFFQGRGVMLSLVCFPPKFGMLTDRRSGFSMWISGRLNWEMEPLPREKGKIAGGGAAYDVFGIFSRSRKLGLLDSFQFLL